MSFNLPESPDSGDENSFCSTDSYNSSYTPFKITRRFQRINSLMKRIEARNKWISLCRKIIQIRKKDNLQRMKINFFFFQQVIHVRLRIKFKYWYRQLKSRNKQKISQRWLSLSKKLLFNSTIFILRASHKIFAIRKWAFFLWRQRYLEINRKHNLCNNSFHHSTANWKHLFHHLRNKQFCIYRANYNWSKLLNHTFYLKIKSAFQLARCHQKWMQFTSSLLELQNRDLFLKVHHQYMNKRNQSLTGRTFIKWSQLIKNSQLLQNLFDNSISILPLEPSENRLLKQVVFETLKTNEIVHSALNDILDSLFFFMSYDLEPFLIPNITHEPFLLHIHELLRRLSNTTVKRITCATDISLPIFHFNTVNIFTESIELSLISLNQLTMTRLSYREIPNIEFPLEPFLFDVSTSINLIQFFNQICLKKEIPFILQPRVEWCDFNLLFCSRTVFLYNYQIPTIPKPFYHDIFQLKLATFPIDTFLYPSITSQSHHILMNQYDFTNIYDLEIEENNISISLNPILYVTPNSYEDGIDIEFDLPELLFFPNNPFALQTYDIISNKELSNHAIESIQIFDCGQILFDIEENTFAFYENDNVLNSVERLIPVDNESKSIESDNIEFVNDIVNDDFSSMLDIYNHINDIQPNQGRFTFDDELDSLNLLGKFSYCELIFNDQFYFLSHFSHINIKESEVSISIAMDYTLDSLLLKTSLGALHTFHLANSPSATIPIDIYIPDLETISSFLDVHSINNFYIQETSKQQLNESNSFLIDLQFDQIFQNMLDNQSLMRSIKPVELKHTFSILKDLAMNFSYLDETIDFCQLNDNYHYLNQLTVKPKTNSMVFPSDINDDIWTCIKISIPISANRKVIDYLTPNLLPSLIDIKSTLSADFINLHEIPINSNLNPIKYYQSIAHHKDNTYSFLQDLFYFSIPSIINSQRISRLGNFESITVNSAMSEEIQYDVEFNLELLLSSENHLTSFTKLELPDKSRIVFLDDSFLKPFIHIHLGLSPLFDFTSPIHFECQLLPNISTPILSTNQLIHHLNYTSLWNFPRIELIHHQLNHLIDSVDIPDFQFYRAAIIIQFLNNFHIQKTKNYQSFQLDYFVDLYEFPIHISSIYYFPSTHQFHNFDHLIDSDDCIIQPFTHNPAKSLFGFNYLSIRVNPDMQHFKTEMKLIDISCNFFEDFRQTLLSISCKQVPKPIIGHYQIELHFNLIYSILSTSLTHLHSLFYLSKAKIQYMKKNSKIQSKRLRYLKLFTNYYTPKIQPMNNLDDLFTPVINHDLSNQITLINDTKRLLDFSQSPILDILFRNKDKVFTLQMASLVSLPDSLNFFTAISIPYHYQINLNQALVSNHLVLNSLSYFTRFINPGYHHLPIIGLQLRGFKHLVLTSLNNYIRKVFFFKISFYQPLLPQTSFFSLPLKFFNIKEMCFYHAGVFHNFGSLQTIIHNINERSINTLNSNPSIKLFNYDFSRIRNSFELLHDEPRSIKSLIKSLKYPLNVTMSFVLPLMPLFSLYSIPFSRDSNIPNIDFDLQLGMLNLMNANHQLEFIQHHSFGNNESIDNLDIQFDLLTIESSRSSVYILDNFFIPKKRLNFPQHFDDIELLNDLLLNKFSESLLSKLWNYDISDKTNVITPLLDPIALNESIKLSIDNNFLVNQNIEHLINFQPTAIPTNSIHNQEIIDDDIFLAHRRIDLEIFESVSTVTSKINDQLDDLLVSILSHIIIDSANSIRFSRMNSIFIFSFNKELIEKAIQFNRILNPINEFALMSSDSGPSVDEISVDIFDFSLNLFTQFSFANALNLKRFFYNKFHSDKFYYAFEGVELIENQSYDVINSLSNDWRNTSISSEGQNIFNFSDTIESFSDLEIPQNEDLNDRFASLFSEVLDKSLKTSITSVTTETASLVTATNFTDSIGNFEETFSIPLLELPEIEGFSIPTEDFSPLIPLVRFNHKRKVPDLDSILFIHDDFVSFNHLIALHTKYLMNFSKEEWYYFPKVFMDSPIHLKFDEIELDPLTNFGDFSYHLHSMLINNFCPVFIQIDYFRDLDTIFYDLQFENGFLVDEKILSINYINEFQQKEKPNLENLDNLKAELQLTEFNYHPHLFFITNYSYQKINNQLFSAFPYQVPILDFVPQLLNNFHYSPYSFKLIDHFHQLLSDIEISVELRLFEPQFLKLLPYSHSSFFHEHIESEISVVNDISYLEELNLTDYINIVRITEFDTGQNIVHRRIQKRNANLKIAEYQNHLESEQLLVNYASNSAYNINNIIATIVNDIFFDIDFPLFQTLCISYEAIIRYQLTRVNFFKHHLFDNFSINLLSFQPLPKHQSLCNYSSSNINERVLGFKDDLLDDFLHLQIVRLPTLFISHSNSRLIQIINNEISNLEFDNVINIEHPDVHIDLTYLTNYQFSRFINTFINQATSMINLPSNFVLSDFNHFSQFHNYLMAYSFNSFLTSYIERLISFPQIDFDLSVADMVSPPFVLKVAQNYQINQFGKNYLSKAVSFLHQSIDFMIWKPFIQNHCLSIYQLNPFFNEFINKQISQITVDLPLSLADLTMSKFNIEHFSANHYLREFIHQQLLNLTIDFNLDLFKNQKYFDYFEFKFPKPADFYSNLKNSINFDVEFESFPFIDSISPSTSHKSIFEKQINDQLFNISLSDFCPSTKFIDCLSYASFNSMPKSTRNAVKLVTSSINHMLNTFSHNLSEIALNHEIDSTNFYISLNDQDIIDIATRDILAEFDSKSNEIFENELTDILINSMTEEISSKCVNDQFQTIFDNPKHLSLDSFAKKEIPIRTDFELYSPELNIKLPMVSNQRLANYYQFHFTVSHSIINQVLYLPQLQTNLPFSFITNIEFFTNSISINEIITKYLKHITVLELNFNNFQDFLNQTLSNPLKLFTRQISIEYTQRNMNLTSYGTDIFDFDIFKSLPISLPKFNFEYIPIFDQNQRFYNHQLDLLNFSSDLSNFTLYTDSRVILDSLINLQRVDISKSTTLANEINYNIELDLNAFNIQVPFLLNITYNDHSTSLRYGIQRAVQSIEDILDSNLNLHEHISREIDSILFNQSHITSDETIDISVLDLIHIIEDQIDSSFITQLTEIVINSISFDISNDIISSLISFTPKENQIISEFTIKQIPITIQDDLYSFEFNNAINTISIDTLTKYSQFEFQPTYSIVYHVQYSPPLQIKLQPSTDQLLNISRNSIQISGLLDKYTMNIHVQEINDLSYDLVQKCLVNVLTSPLNFIEKPCIIYYLNRNRNLASYESDIFTYGLLDDFLIPKQSFYFEFIPIFDSNHRFYSQHLNEINFTSDFDFISIYLDKIITINDLHNYAFICIPKSITLANEINYNIEFDLNVLNVQVPFLLNITYNDHPTSLRYGIQRAVQSIEDILDSNLNLHEHISREIDSILFNQSHITSDEIIDISILDLIHIIEDQIDSSFITQLTEIVINGISFDISNDIISSLISFTPKENQIISEFTIKQIPITIQDDLYSFEFNNAINTISIDKLNEYSQFEFQSTYSIVNQIQYSPPLQITLQPLSNQTIVFTRNPIRICEVLTKYTKDLIPETINYLKNDVLVKTFPDLSTKLYLINMQSNPSYRKRNIDLNSYESDLCHYQTLDDFEINTPKISYHFSQVFDSNQQFYDRHLNEIDFTSQLIFILFKLKNPNINYLTNVEPIHIPKSTKLADDMDYELAPIMDLFGIDISRLMNTTYNRQPKTLRTAIKESLKSINEIITPKLKLGQSIDSRSFKFVSFSSKDLIEVAVLDSLQYIEKGIDESFESELTKIALNCISFDISSEIVSSLISFTPKQNQIIFEFTIKQIPITIQADLYSFEFNNAINTISIDTLNKYSQFEFQPTYSIINQINYSPPLQIKLQSLTNHLLNLTRNSIQMSGLFDKYTRNIYNQEIKDIYSVLVHNCLTNLLLNQLSFIDKCCITYYLNRNRNPASYESDIFNYELLDDFLIPKPSFSFEFIPVFDSNHRFYGQHLDEINFTSDFNFISIYHDNIITINDLHNYALMCIPKSTTLANEINYNIEFELNVLNLEVPFLLNITYNDHSTSLRYGIQRAVQSIEDILDSNLNLHEHISREIDSILFNQSHITSDETIDISVLDLIHIIKDQIETSFITQLTEIVINSISFDISNDIVSSLISFTPKENQIISEFTIKQIPITIQDDLYSFEFNNAINTISIDKLNEYSQFEFQPTYFIVNQIQYSPPLHINLPHLHNEILHFASNSIRMTSLFDKYCKNIYSFSPTFDKFINFSFVFLNSNSSKNLYIHRNIDLNRYNDLIIDFNLDDHFCLVQSNYVSNHIETLQPIRIANPNKTFSQTKLDNFDLVAYTFAIELCHDHSNNLNLFVKKVIPRSTQIANQILIDFNLQVAINPIIIGHLISLTYNQLPKSIRLAVIKTMEMIDSNLTEIISKQFNDLFNGKFEVDVTHFNISSMNSTELIDISVFESKKTIESYLESNISNELTQIQIDQISKAIANQHIHEQSIELHHQSLFNFSRVIIPSCISDISYHSELFFCLNFSSETILPLIDYSVFSFIPQFLIVHNLLDLITTSEMVNLKNDMKFSSHNQLNNYQYKSINTEYFFNKKVHNLDATIQIHQMSPMLRKAIQKVENLSRNDANRRIKMSRKLSQYKSNDLYKSSELIDLNIISPHSIDLFNRVEIKDPNQSFYQNEINMINFIDNGFIPDKLKPKHQMDHLILMTPNQMPNFAKMAETVEIDDLLAFNLDFITSHISIDKINDCIFNFMPRSIRNSLKLTIKSIQSLFSLSLSNELDQLIHKQLDLTFVLFSIECNEIAEISVNDVVREITRLFEENFDNCLRQIEFDSVIEQTVQEFELKEIILPFDLFNQLSFFESIKLPSYIDSSTYIPHFEFDFNPKLSLRPIQQFYPFAWHQIFSSLNRLNCSLVLKEVPINSKIELLQLNNLSPNENTIDKLIGNPIYELKLNFFSKLPGNDFEYLLNSSVGSSLMYSKRNIDLNYYSPDLSIFTINQIQIFDFSYLLKVDLTSLLSYSLIRQQKHQIIVNDLQLSNEFQFATSILEQLFSPIKLVHSKTFHNNLQIQPNIVSQITANLLTDNFDTFNLSPLFFYELSSIIQSQIDELIINNDIASIALIDFTSFASSLILEHNLIAINRELDEIENTSADEFIMSLNIPDEYDIFVSEKKVKENISDYISTNFMRVLGDLFNQTVMNTSFLLLQSPTHFEEDIKLHGIINLIYRNIELERNNFIQTTTFDTLISMYQYQKEHISSQTQLVDSKDLFDIQTKLLNDYHSINSLWHFDVVKGDDTNLASSFDMNLTTEFLVGLDMSSLINFSKIQFNPNVVIDIELTALPFIANQLSSLNEIQCKQIAQPVTEFVLEISLNSLKIHNLMYIDNYSKQYIKMIQPRFDLMLSFNDLFRNISPIECILFFTKKSIENQCDEYKFNFDGTISIPNNSIKYLINLIPFIGFSIIPKAVNLFILMLNKDFNLALNQTLNRIYSELFNFDINQTYQLLDSDLLTNPVIKTIDSIFNSTSLTIFKSIVENGFSSFDVLSTNPDNRWLMIDYRPILINSIAFNNLNEIVSKFNCFSRVLPIQSVSIDQPLLTENELIRNSAKILESIDCYQSNHKVTYKVDEIDDLEEILPDFSVSHVLELRTKDKSVFISDSLRLFELISISPLKYIFLNDSLVTYDSLIHFGQISNREPKVNHNADLMPINSIKFISNSLKYLNAFQSGKYKLNLKKAEKLVLKEIERLFDALLMKSLRITNEFDLHDQISICLLNEISFSMDFENNLFISTLIDPLYFLTLNTIQTGIEVDFTCILKEYESNLTTFVKPLFIFELVHLIQDVNNCEFNLMCNFELVPISPIENYTPSQFKSKSRIDSSLVDEISFEISFTPVEPSLMKLLNFEPNSNTTMNELLLDFTPNLGLTFDIKSVEQLLNFTPRSLNYSLNDISIEISTDFDLFNKFINNQLISLTRFQSNSSEMKLYNKSITKVIQTISSIIHNDFYSFICHPLNEFDLVFYKSLNDSVMQRAIEKHLEDSLTSSIQFNMSTNYSAIYNACLVTIQNDDFDFDLSNIISFDGFKLAQKNQLNCLINFQHNYDESIVKQDAIIQSVNFVSLQIEHHFLELIQNPKPMFDLNHLMIKDVQLQQALVILNNRIDSLINQVLTKSIISNMSANLSAMSLVRMNPDSEDVHLPPPEIDINGLINNRFLQLFDSSLKRSIKDSWKIDNFDLFHK